MYKQTLQSPLNKSNRDDGLRGHMTLRSIKCGCYASSYSYLVGVPISISISLADKRKRFVDRFYRIGCSFAMDRKGVIKLINGISKFSTLNHLSANLDRICLGITDVNDSLRLGAKPHRLLKSAILYFTINTPFLSFAASKSFYLSVCLNFPHRCPLLVAKQDF